MENFFSRYKNPLVLMLILFIQVVALATQVKRAETGGRTASSSGGTRLIRVWTVTAITPVERVLVSTGHFFRRNWHNYIDLHDARKQNQQLQEELARLKLEQVRLREDAGQAQRLQALLGFRERYVGQTMAAQVIGASGSEQSRVLYIDKGARDGVKIDMAVITPDGVVGKIKDVFPLSSQIILINDRDGGAGVILQNSRLQGVLSGTPQGELKVKYIMADENVSVGEPVVTSGGDRIFPKGMPVGTVSEVSPDREGDPFLSIKVKPASNLSQLEEVLIVTRQSEQSTQLTSGNNSVRAADILAERLPTVNPTPSPTPAKAPGAKKTAASANSAAPAQASPLAGSTNPATGAAKPAVAAAAPRPSPSPSAASGTGVTGVKPSGAVTTGSGSQPKPAQNTTTKTGGTQPIANSATGTATSNPSAQKKPATTASPTPSPSVSPKNPSGATTSAAGAGNTTTKTGTPKKPQPKPSASPTASPAADTATPAAGSAERPPR